MDSRLAPERAQHHELFDTLSLRLNTCMPGVIKDFNPSTQTCTVTPALLAKTYQDGVRGSSQLPDIPNVPLYFPFASLAGFALTLPIRTGDPCLLIFSQRCIDNWHEFGGVQPTEDAIGGRHHDLSDAFALCCAPSLVDVLDNYCTDGIELRNRSSQVSLTLRDSGLTINGDVSINGKLSVSDNVNIASDLTAMKKIITALGVDLSIHQHGGVLNGGGTTGVPQ